MVRTRVGYCGGTKKSPTYRSLGDHTESVEIDFDPTKTSYERLLDVFWAEHDPTERPWSRQYQAFVFVHDEAQDRAARASLKAVAARARGPVTTEIRAYETFWPAEDYHQKYALRGDPLLAAELHAIYPDETAFRDSTVAARVNGFLGGAGTRLSLRAVEKDLGLSERAIERLRSAVGDRGGSAAACPAPR